jgi:hypothetical protein
MSSPIEQNVPQPMEKAPIGALAARVQAEPSFAMELPQPEETAHPEHWGRRLRFILEAALCGELDDRRLVEEIPGLNRRIIPTFSLLADALDQVYRPVLEDKLSEVHAQESWQPVFKRMTTVFAYDPAEREDPPLFTIHRLLKHQGSVAVSQVEKLSQVTMRYGAHTPERIAAIIRSGGVAVTRRQANRCLKVANFIGNDWKEGDRHGVLELPEGTDDLHFNRPVGNCPVSYTQRTVDEIEEQEKQWGWARIGCPALKNSRLIEKLMNRAADDALRHRTLETVLSQTRGL